MKGQQPAGSLQKPLPLLLLRLGLVIRWHLAKQDLVPYQAPVHRFGGELPLQAVDPEIPLLFVRTVAGHTMPPEKSHPVLSAHDRTGTKKRTQHGHKAAEEQSIHERNPVTVS
jgi:hypothetical protein